jgi:hypothetical protein
LIPLEPDFIQIAAGKQASGKKAQLEEEEAHYRLNSTFSVAPLSARLLDYCGRLTTGAVWANATIQHAFKQMIRLVVSRSNQRGLCHSNSYLFLVGLLARMMRPLSGNLSACTNFGLFFTPPPPPPEL